MSEKHKMKRSGISVSPSRKVFLAFDLLIITVLALSCVLPFVNLLAISFSNKTAVAGNRVGLWPIGFNTAALSICKSTAADHLRAPGAAETGKRPGRGVIEPERVGCCMSEPKRPSFPASVKNPAFVFGDSTGGFIP